MGSKKTHPSKYIGCFYGTSSTTKKRSKHDSNKNTCIKTRNVNTPRFDCPFKIRYAYVDYKRGSKKPSIYYQVKITKSSHYMHTCHLNSASHRQALISSGTLQPNIQGI